MRRFYKIIFLLLLGLNIGYSAAPSVTISWIDISPTSTSQGAINVGVLELDIIMSKLTALWSLVQVDLTGTATDSDIDSVKIWRDNGGGLLTATKIGSGIFTSNTSLITLYNPETISSTSQKYYVTYDISSTAVTSNSAKASMLNETYFTMDKPVLATNFPINSTDMSLPVELSSWSVIKYNGHVKLNWTTDSEFENLGFIIERNGIEIASFITDSNLIGQGSITDKTDYEYIDYHRDGEYQLIDVDYQNVKTYHNKIKIDDSDVTCYPNPFNSVITFEVKNAKIEIFNMKGQLIETLNSNQWITNRGSGIYIVRIQTETSLYSRQITLIK